VPFQKIIGLTGMSVYVAALPFVFMGLTAYFMGAPFHLSTIQSFLRAGVILIPASSIVFTLFAPGVLGQESPADWHKKSYIYKITTALSPGAWFAGIYQQITKVLLKAPKKLSANKESETIQEAGQRIKRNTVVTFILFAG